MPRAINFTNSEMSSTFWILGIIFFVVAFMFIYDMYRQVPLTEFIFIFFLLIIGMVFFTMAWFWPNYIITKYNLNLFVDRITNPNYIGWIRFSRTKGMHCQIVKTGPLGQQKGMANNAKADIINTGDFTVTLRNGNKAVIKSDLLSTNVNLDKAIGWQLIKKHFSVWGYKAWEKCVDEGKTLFKVEEKVDEKGREGVQSETIG